MRPYMMLSLYPPHVSGARRSKYARGSEQAHNEPFIRRSAT
jgi:hypothetical protein